MATQDLSRFTIPTSSADEKKKKIVFTPSESVEEKKHFFQYFTSNPLWIGVYAVLIIVAIASGVYLFRAGSDSEKDTNQVIPTDTPVAENSPTPTKTEEPVDFSSFSVTVLNGSGIAGEAGRVQTLLEDGGFTVSKTGNADRYDYEETVVYIKENVPEQVTEELGSLIGEFSLIMDEAYEGEEADIVIIVGKQ